MCKHTYNIRQNDIFQGNNKMIQIYLQFSKCSSFIFSDRLKIIIKYTEVSI